jgi:dihydroorotase
MNLLIQNGHVVDPSQELDSRADVWIEDGVVAGVGRNLKTPASVERIDAAGMIVTPGFIDLHTHLREPGQEHKETIRTGTLAAVAGGYTAVCAMANTVPPNDERAVTEMIIAEARRNGHCRVYPIGAVSKGLRGDALAEMADLHTAGCVGVSDDGHPVYNAQLMRRALEYAQMLGIPVIAHEEDHDLTEGGVMHEGYYSTLLGLNGIPAASEETLVARDVILARVTGGHLHVAHLSTAGAVEAVRNARRAGVRVTCEVTPHHIALTDEAVTSFSTRFKMNPPLRSREHVDAVIEGIVDGTVDAIATDHAPHHFDEKNVEFDLAPFGVIGLETAFSIAYKHLVAAKRITLSRLIDLLSCGPARVFNLPGGSLRGGALGDLTLIATGTTWEAGGYLSKAANSPFTGLMMQGRVGMTVVGGVVKFDGGMKAPAASPAKKKSAGRGGKKKP